MQTKLNRLLLNALLLQLALTLSDAIEAKVSVKVKPKQFNGFSKIIGGKQVDIFLGIPYAKPPIGDLRFKKPIPVNNYDKPIDATRWPNPCIQRVKYTEKLAQQYHNTNFSEDCLYLNIWTPNDSANDINESMREKQLLKPVLVWIHGGGLIVGSSNMIITSGETLAAKGDVVVVSINYRLDYFGFFYSGTDDAPGNVGLWDQALALKWVNDNVEYFGGDPNRITIFGASAGGWSVSLLLVSPITRHLYKNAVVMSGSAHVMYTKDAKLALNSYTEVAKKLSCDRQSISSTFECLRNVAAQDFMSDKFDKSLTEIRVIYGDEFLPAKPIDMLKTGDCKRNANVLLGTTDDEGSVFLGGLHDNITYALLNPKNLSKSEALVELRKIFSLFGESLANAHENAHKLYISQSPENSYDLIRRSIGTAIGDYMLTCPTLHLAKALFTGNNATVYQYLFSGAKNANSWHGSDHYSDVVFWFGNNVVKNKSSVASDLSDRMIDIISHFAKYGKPSPQEGIEWQSYYRINDNIVTPYYEIADEINKVDGNYGFGYKYHCEILWNKFFEP